MYVIEHDIPIPANHLKYPFAQMVVGDSFFAPCAIGKSTIYSARYRTGHVYFAAPETIDGVEGTRVWRIEGETQIKSRRKRKA